LELTHFRYFTPNFFNLFSNGFVQYLLIVLQFIKLRDLHFHALAHDSDKLNTITISIHNPASKPKPEQSKGIVPPATPGTLPQSTPSHCFPAQS
jgi:hypothetical protein